MKRLAVLLAVALPMLAAKWDGTRGAYTISTQSYYGAEPRTVVTVTSSDPGHDIIIITAYLNIPTDQGMFGPKTVVKVVSAHPGRPEAAIFPYPEATIDRLIVCGYTEGQKQMFDRPFQRP